MAVAPTGAIYKALEFNGVSSRTYGVYITGEAVYNAPERDVEMITIPGRNGSFALDNGRFENIEVTYPAGIFADTEADFRQAISEFRNFLCSRKGYVRLQDEYNPDEYRLAVYKSGLEVEPAMLRAGEFDIVFDCKPQRFLTSGETAVSVDSGDTLTNPTLFEASPLLEIEGYGTLNVNGTEIEIADELVGDVTVDQPVMKTSPYNIMFPPVYINNGDTIDIHPKIYVTYKGKNTTYNISSSSIVSWSGDASSSPTIAHGGTSFTTTCEFDAIAFIYGTPSTKSVTFRASVIQGGVTSQIDITHAFSYDGNKTITFSTTAADTSAYSVTYMAAGVGNSNKITIHSTATTFGHPTYIDCDLGEAYADDNGVISSLNSYIALGSKLPTLSPGSNTITFDNTITDLKVTPRWWKI